MSQLPNTVLVACTPPKIYSLYFSIDQSLYDSSFSDLIFRSIIGERIRLNGSQPHSFSLHRMAAPNADAADSGSSPIAGLKREEVMP